MVNTHQLLVDIEWLKTAKNWDTDDRQELEDFSRMVSIHEAYLSLRDNPVIQNRVERMRQSIAEIDEKLTSDRKLNDMERQYFFAKKDVYREELALYGVDMEQDVEDIAQTVSNHLSRMKVNNL